MKRGKVWDVRLDPVEGTEQAGVRPAVIVSADSLPPARRRVIVVPFTTLRPGRRIYVAEAVIRTPDGGLTADSVALGDQVRTVSTVRLLRRRGTLPAEAMELVETVLAIALGLPLPPPTS